MSKKQNPISNGLNNSVGLDKNEAKMYEAISALPGKIIGHDELFGIYNLAVFGSAGTDEPFVPHCVGKQKFELERGGEENYMRFSFVSFHMKHLMGEVLTTLEASIQNEGQLKAVKSIVKNYFGRKLDWIYENCGTPYEEQDSLMDSEI